MNGTFLSSVLHASIVCNIAIFRVARKHCVQYCFLPCCTQALCAILLSSVLHASIVCNIAFLHVARKHCVKYCFPPCCTPALHAILLSSVLHASIVCNVAFLRVAHKHCVHYCVHVIFRRVRDITTSVSCSFNEYKMSCVFYENDL